MYLKYTQKLLLTVCDSFFLLICFGGFYFVLFFLLMYIRIHVKRLEQYP